MKKGFRERKLLLREKHLRVTQSGGKAWAAFVHVGKYFPRYTKSRHRDSSESRTARWRKLTVKRRAAARREKGKGATAAEGQGEIYPCGNVARVAHLAKSCAAAAATDPPTLTGDEKGRENERRAESRCGASRLSHERKRETERERKGRGEKGEVRRGLDAEISVTYSSCEDFNAVRRWKSNRDKVCDYFDRYDKRRSSVPDVT